MLFDDGALSRLLSTISSPSARAYFSRGPTGQPHSTLGAMSKGMQILARRCEGLSEIALLLCDVADGLTARRASQVLRWSDAARAVGKTESTSALTPAHLNRLTELYLAAAGTLESGGFQVSDDMQTIRIEGYAPLALVVDDACSSKGQPPNWERDTSRPSARKT